MIKTKSEKTVLSLNRLKLGIRAKVDKCLHTETNCKSLCISFK
jgi:hypothetical protein